MVLIITAGSISGCLSQSEEKISDEEEDLTPLRINHIQVKGTHNSYHLAPIGPTIRAYDYSHDPLDIQAEDGIRDSVASRGLGDVYKRQLQCWGVDFLSFLL